MRLVTSNLVRTWLQPVLALTVLVGVISFGTTKPKAQNNWCVPEGVTCTGRGCPTGTDLGPYQWGLIHYVCFDPVTGDLYDDYEPNGCCMDA